MRVLSFAVGLAAAASVAIAGNCGKVSKGSSSSSLTSAPSPTMTSSSTSSTATSSTSSPLATFSLVARNSGDPYADGQDLQTAGDSRTVQIAPSLSTFSIALLHLEPVTNYLMAGSLYVAYSPDNQVLYTVSASSIQPGSYVQLICGPPHSGDAISCVPDGYPTYTKFSIYGQSTYSIHVLMVDPSSPPLVTGDVTFDFVAQAV